jgi:hypothetical protein
MHSMEHDEIPPHEAAVRRMVADAHGRTYDAYQSLENAARDEEAAVVLQGDEGGTIYLTCPVRLIRCDQRALKSLLGDLDKLEWNEPESAGLYFEHAPVGAGVVGGMGGGAVTDGVWLHPRLEAKGIREAVEAVIAGERSHI